MIVSYIILAHKDPDHVARMINRLESEKSRFFVHVDLKTDIKPFIKCIGRRNCVTFIENRVSVTWGNISMIEATMICILRILTEVVEGYVVLLSGQDYPLRSSKDIESLLLKNSVLNYISIKPINEVWNNSKIRIRNYNFHPFPNKRYCLSVPAIIDYRILFPKNILKLSLLLISKKRRNIFKLFRSRQVPNKMQLFGGSQWWALPVNTLQQIVSFLETNTSYMEYHRFTHVPDEIFFHTLIGNLIDPEWIHDSLTYVNWEDQNRPLPVTFNTSDWEDLKTRDHLFARKFSSNTEILDLIDDMLLTKNDVDLK